MAGPNRVRMNRRLLTILVIAFAIAGICAFLVYRIVTARMVASKPVATNRVVAAAKDIPLGAVVSASDLTTLTIAGTAPKGALWKPEQAIGRGAITEIFQGEPVLDSQLAGLGSGGGLAPTIPDGMRASAVRVDEVVGVAGFVIPGMRVDVLVSGNPPGGGGSEGVVTKTILQNIQVISAGTDIQRDAEGKPQQVQVVTLLVTPEQAQILSLASNLKIQLVLRNPLDTKVEDVPENNLNSLFAGKPAPTAQHVAPQRAPKAAPTAYSVEVINGTKTSEEKFPSSGGSK
jgi:pilus assembly protein CpaB